jgi:hypothetical protein
VCRADRWRRIFLVFSLAFHKESRSSTASSQPRADFLLRPFSPSSTVLNNAHVRCLQSLRGDCSRAGGTRRFSRVNCREVPKTCSGAFRTPGRCGLLSESSSQNGTEPPATAIPAGLDSRTTVRRMTDRQNSHHVHGQCGSGGWPGPHLFCGHIARHPPESIATPGRPMSRSSRLALDIRCLFAYTRAPAREGQRGVVAGLVADNDNDELERTRQSRVRFICRVGEKYLRRHRSFATGWDFESGDRRFWRLPTTVSRIVCRPT